MCRKIGLLSVVAFITILQQSALISDANSACTTVTLDYESYNTATHPYAADPVWPDWTASANYRPCGSPPGTQANWRATQNTGNTLKIETGSTIYVGPKWTNDVYVKATPTKPTFYIKCGGSMTDPGRAPGGYPWCKAYEN